MAIIIDPLTGKKIDPITGLPVRQSNDFREQLPRPGRQAVSTRTTPAVERTPKSIAGIAREETSGIPDIIAPVTGMIPPYTPAVDRAPAPVFDFPEFRGALSAGARAVTRAIEQPRGELAGELVEQEKGRLATAEAAERQRLQDLLGKAGLASTVRGIAQMGELESGLSRERSESLQSARMRGRAFEEEQRQKAIDQALGFGELGAKETAAAGQLGLGYAELGQREREAYVEALGVKDRLSFDVWAEQQGINENERDRIWSAVETEKQLESARELGFAELGVKEKELYQQGQQFTDRIGFDRWATTQGYSDNEKNRVWQAIQNDKSIGSAEKITLWNNESAQKIANMNITSSEKMTMSNIALEKELAKDRNYLTQQGIDAEKAKIYGYTKEDGTYVPGALDVAARSLGLQEKEYEDQRNELYGYTDEKGIFVPGKMKLLGAADQRDAARLYGYKTTDLQGNELFVPGELQLKSDANAIARQGLTLEEAKLRGYDDDKGNHVMGELEARGKELGLESERLDLQKMELLGDPQKGIKGKLEIETGKLEELVRTGDTQRTSMVWDRVLEYAGILAEENPEQAAALIAQTAGNLTDEDGNRIPIPTYVRNFREMVAIEHYAGEANKTPEEIAISGEYDFDGDGENDVRIWLGKDGMTRPKPGEDENNPISFNVKEGNFNASIHSGQYVEFATDDNLGARDMAYNITVPDGTYLVRGLNSREIERLEDNIAVVVKYGKDYIATGKQIGNVLVYEDVNTGKLYLAKKFEDHGNTQNSQLRGLGISA